MLPKKKIISNGKVVIAQYEESVFIPDKIFEELDNSVQKIILVGIEQRGIPYTNDTNPRFISKSICDEDDQYSKNIGIDIASEKCDKKYHFAMVKRCSYYISVLENMIETLNRIKEKHENKIVNIYRDIRRIGGC